MAALRHLLAWFEGLGGLRLEVRGQSMTPTLAPGTRLVARRLPKRWGRLRRGDVVVVRPPDQAERIELKRILGLPQETISWIGGAIRVNHQPLEEPYARIPASPPGDELRTVHLSDGEYFVAGDNRLYSHDSRRYGPVQREAILGVLR